MPAKHKDLIDPTHDEWPKNELEAVDRANLYRERDPYPGKKAALLGSDDFLDYARVTGMIFPCEAFDKVSKKADELRIKPASYEVRPGQKFFRFEESGQLTAIELGRDEGKFIHLPANSITFVSTNERFRLPLYVAMRFNLRIQHVHRGILLGTGPLVDPGYGQNILIPLHNLTDEDYYIPTNRGLIWVEFTKTSWTKPVKQSSNQHNVDLPETTEKELRQFLIHANQGRPIRSSIPKAVVEANASAMRAERQAKKLEQQIRAFGIVGLLALILTLAGVLVPMLSLVQDTATVLDDARGGIADTRRQVDQLRTDLETMRNEMEKQPRREASAK